MFLGFSSSRTGWSASARSLSGSRLACNHFPHPRQVVSRRRESDFHPHFLQAPPPELPQTPLVLQHSKYRFNPRLAQAIDRPPQWASQLLPHLPMQRMNCPAPQAPAPGSNPARKRRSSSPPDLPRPSAQRIHYRRSPAGGLPGSAPRPPRRGESRPRYLPLAGSPAPPRSDDLRSPPS